MTAATCGCGCGGHDERHAPAAPYNPPGRTALDYRVGDYGSFLAAMLDRLASPAYPALRGLTVRTPDDPAIGLLDAWSVLGDLLTFHSERIANEGYLRTATEHRSLALLGRLVGHRPRPGVSADTLLAYTVDRDPRSTAAVPVLIPRGARSHSVPAASDEEARTFETAADLTARWDWNELAVRRRRPLPLTPDDLRERAELFFAGTANSLQVGDKLLLLFGEDTSGTAERLLLPVTRVRIDRDDDMTAIGLPQSAVPSLGELVEELQQWITPSAGSPNPRPAGSELIEDFDTQVLAQLRADLDRLTTPDTFARRLDDPIQRLWEAQALAAPYETVATWFDDLTSALLDLQDRSSELEPGGDDQGGGGQSFRGAERVVGATDPQTAALRALGTTLPALRKTALHRGTAYRAPTPDSDLAAQILTALNPRVADTLYTAWRAATPPTPTAAAQQLREVLAMRLTAAPFGATAPLKPVQDDRGRVIRQSDWPLTGAALTTMRVVFDTAGKVPVRAEFQYVEAGTSVQHSENLSGPPSAEPFDLGPGRVELSTRTAQDHDLSWLIRRPADSQEPGVTARLLPELPDRTLFVSRPAEDGRIHVAILGGDALPTADSEPHSNPRSAPHPTRRTAQPLQWHLEPGQDAQVTDGPYEVTVRYASGSEPPNVEIGLATVPAAPGRRVLQLDSVADGITPGSWVAVERPRKGADTPDGIPGDKSLALVTTRVTAVRTAAYADFGITGRGTELTLADPWLDEHDVLLSHIRDTVVHARGEALRPADEPLGEDVHGNEIELAELYEGLHPGRLLVVSGERTDIPGTSGVTGTEPAVIAAVQQAVDPHLPGDHVHTRLTLASDLVHHYRRDTVRIQGNVVPATHGESRDEPIGSGDAGRTHQSFALWQSPLIWLPADNPLGATPTLEVRVDGLLWHRVDSLAGRGPRERVYVLGTGADGRPSVTFGDGVHGARLPSGHDNVRARYRFGTGRAANVAAHRITQAITRPLGVTAVTNPLPATGGADPDGPGQTRSTIPLSVSALDRLVSVRDYEDFARSRAGIGRAAARELFDGRRPLLHVTVAGADDVPLAEDSEVLRALRSSLATYGDARLPVRVDVRELVLLLLVARVKVLPDHAWDVVEPRLRAALLHHLGYPGRALGQSAQLSEVLAVVQAVPGVDYLDVDAFTGVPASVTPDELAGLAGRLTEPRPAVPARAATYDERIHRVTAEGGETLTAVAARYGVPLAELLRLNPDITDTRPLEKGRSLFVFRGIRPAQLALFSPDVPGTLILTEVDD